MSEMNGSVKFMRRNRHWQILIEAPDWVISELASEARERGLFMLNYGGASGDPNASMLIGTSVNGSNPYDERRSSAQGAESDE